MKHSAATSLRLVVLLVGTLLSVVTLCGTPAFAETLSISPPKFDLFGSPGDVVSEKIKVRNDSTSALNYDTSVADFTANGDLGGVNINDDPKAPTSNYSLAKWVTVQPVKFSVAPGQEKILNVIIKIPANAEPGGHYASVQLSLAGAPTAGSGASVVSKIDSLILLRVSGNLTEKLSLDSFTTDNNYYPNGPVNFLIRAKNQGNVHVAPTGTIIITDMFGRKAQELDFSGANVLPNSDRLVKVLWDQKGMFGRYTAQLVATYGQTRQPLSASVSFIIFPPILIAVIIGILLLTIILISQRKQLKKMIHSLSSD